MQNVNLIADKPFAFDTIATKSGGVSEWERDYNGIPGGLSSALDPGGWAGLLLDRSSEAERAGG